MSTTTGNHGEFAFGPNMRATALEHRRKAPKLDVNAVAALWDEIRATNRAAGPWGADRPALRGFAK